MQSHFIKDSNLHCTEGSHIALLPTPKFLLDEKFWLIPAEPREAPKGPTEARLI